METVLGTYNGPKTVLVWTGSVVLVFSASSSPSSRLPLYSTAPSPYNSDTHNGSSMLALTYTKGASDDHLPSFVSSASGIVFAASLVAHRVLTNCSWSSAPSL